MCKLYVNACVEGKQQYSRQHGMACEPCNHWCKLQVVPARQGGANLTSTRWSAQWREDRIADVLSSPCYPCLFMGMSDKGGTVTKLMSKDLVPKEWYLSVCAIWQANRCSLACLSKHGF